MSGHDHVVVVFDVEGHFADRGGFHDFFEGFHGVVEDVFGAHVDFGDDDEDWDVEVWGEGLENKKRNKFKK